MLPQIPLVSLTTFKCLNLLFSKRLTLTVLFNPEARPLPAHQVPCEYSFCSGSFTVPSPRHSASWRTASCTHPVRLLSSSSLPPPFPSTLRQRGCSGAGLFVSDDTAKHLCCLRDWMSQCLGEPVPPSPAYRSLSNIFFTEDCLVSPCLMPQEAFH